MLKLSHNTKNIALAALLTAGLAGSAAVTFTPVVSHAQTYRDYDDHGGRGYDRDYYRDRDDRYRGDWDNRYRGNWDDRYHPYADNRGWVGVGVPGFGVGFYDYPYYNGYYGPYCSDYDYYNGFCSY